MIENLTRIKKLGEGQYGDVYLEQDNQGTKYAVKYLKNIDEKRTKRFLREGNILERLDHQNIVTIYDFSTKAKNPYIVMEYAHEGSLSNIINKKKLSPAKALKYFEDIIMGVEHLHKYNIIHRDLKPDNILLKANRCIITDFGIAKESGKKEIENLTKTGEFMGTPAYMSPEHMKNITIDKRSDLFSAGIIFYEMLTGSRPFQGNNLLQTARNVMFTHPPHPSELNKEIIDNLSQICMRCLEKEKKFRYHSCKEILSDINKIKNGEQLKPIPFSVSRLLHKNKKLFLGIGITTVALGAVIPVNLYYAHYYQNLTDNQRKIQNEIISSKNELIKKNKEYIKKYELSQLSSYIANGTLIQDLNSSEKITNAWKELNKELDTQYVEKSKLYVNLLNILKYEVKSKKEYIEALEAIQNITTSLIDTKEDSFFLDKGIEAIFSQPDQLLLLKYLHEFYHKVSKNTNYTRNVKMLLDYYSKTNEELKKDNSIQKDSHLMFLDLKNSTENEIHKHTLYFLLKKREYEYIRSFFPENDKIKAYVSNVLHYYEDKNITSYPYHFQVVYAYFLLEHHLTLRDKTHASTGYNKRNNKLALIAYDILNKYKPQLPYNKEFNLTYIHSKTEVRSYHLILKQIEAELLRSYESKEYSELRTDPYFLYLRDLFYHGGTLGPYRYYRTPLTEYKNNPPHFIQEGFERFMLDHLQMTDTFLKVKPSQTSTNYPFNSYYNESQLYRYIHILDEITKTFHWAKQTHLLKRYHDKISKQEELFTQKRKEILKQIKYIPTNKQ